MNIGIISINIHTKTLNYGCIIHSFALQQFLRLNGIDSTVIEYKPNYYGVFDVKHPLFSLVEREKLDGKQLIKWKDLFYDREKRYDKFFGFVNNYYKKTDKCYTPELLDKEDPGFDVYICASDVIWKATEVGFDKGFFLASKCMNNKIKIAYSASMGARKYNEQQEKQFIEWVGDFDFVSAREDSLQKYIKDRMDIDARHVVDPVFLLPRSFYEQLQIKPDYTLDKYILVYLAQDMDEAFVKKVIGFAKDKGLPIIELSEELHHEKYALEEGVNLKVVYNAGVEEWLWYINHAEWIFTNSFHGTCFSIIFEKQFFCGARGGDKIKSLLNRFAVSDRWIVADSFVGVDSIGKIDYDTTSELVKHASSLSADFLISALKECNERVHKPLVANPKVFIERSRIEWIEKYKQMEIQAKEKEWDKRHRILGKFRRKYKKIKSVW
ncbi:polysaccharide pyruvyl transferase family protein [Butyrivibrio sp. NC2002]|uniref:polysaccharide pyruvyl transferase family protein n=1 Tax=Butyrivibrio sp. NC2002 TaxID=1410610 RepID=UPI00055D3DCA|nr:polysaccharide pyruvyl transferase family protein [Butyrivibrio sp. NC2002]